MSSFFAMLAAKKLAGGGGGAARYWRMEVLEINQAPYTGTHYIRINEMEFYTTVGGADVANGGAAIGSGSYAAYPPSNAFDGITTTIWYERSTGTGGGFPYWIGYDFGADVSIVQFGYRSNNTGQTPTKVMLQKSSDGVTWIDVEEFSVSPTPPSLTFTKFTVS